MIPDEAVEAAAAAVREGLIQNYVRFDDLARAALEAAAPHMHQASWTEGYDAAKRYYTPSPECPDYS